MNENQTTENMRNIPMLQEQLEKALTTLGTGIDGLDNQLQSLCNSQPVDTTMSSDEVPKKEQSEMGAWLESMVAMVESHYQKIQNLRNELEL